VNKRLILALTIIIILGILGFNTLAATQVTGFSADFKMTDAKDKVATGKIYMSGSKIRQETVVEDVTSVVILRLDKKVSWTLMEENQYMEMKMPFDPAHPEESDVQYEKATIGTETINGYTCQMVQYTYKEKKYGIMTQWVADKLGFPIKVQSKDSKNKKVTMTMEYTNIKVGKQPDSLFEIPEGYEKFALPFKIPGM
jgi:outer membrane lipoprotein-sorting protein